MQGPHHFPPQVATIWTLTTRFFGRKPDVAVGSSFLFRVCPADLFPLGGVVQPHPETAGRCLQTTWACPRPAEEVPQVGPCGLLGPELQVP